jgi:hypothetical protein
MGLAWWLHPGLHQTARMEPDHYIPDGHGAHVPNWKAGRDSMGSACCGRGHTEQKTTLCRRADEVLLELLRR